MDTSYLTNSSIARTQIMPQAVARMATRDRDAGRHQRHRTEQTLLYLIVDGYYPAFTAHLARQGK